MKVEEGKMLVKFINASPIRDKNGEYIQLTNGKVKTKYDRSHKRCYAVIVAVDRNKIGWSQVNEKEIEFVAVNDEGEVITDKKGRPLVKKQRDHFDKEKGIQIARMRAYNCIIDNGKFGASENTTVPHGLLVHLEEMRQRAEHYFK